MLHTTDLNVGDAAYIGRVRGSPSKGTVTKKTATGQVVVTVKTTQGGYDMRFTPRGDEVGASGFRGAFLTSKERYDEDMAGRRVQDEIRAIQGAARAIADAPTSAWHTDRADMLRKIDAMRKLVSEMG